MPVDWGHPPRTKQDIKNHAEKGQRPVQYHELEAVNKSIKTTDIKGKEYAEVNQRILAFRKLFPEGFLWTEITERGEDTVVIKASAGYFEDVEGGKRPVVLGVGHAHERENANPINKTSFLEVAETSAIGRALGMIGIGVAAALASAEEVQNAIQVQNAPGATLNQIKTLNRLYTGEARVAALQKFNVLDWNKLTVQQASELIQGAPRG